MSTSVDCINLSVAETQAVLLWLEQFNFSRPMRKINRDFSDAVLLAEILKTQYPKLVDLHNYASRNAIVQKYGNWTMLNNKVLKKLKINLNEKMLGMLANSAPGMIEKLLSAVKDKIAKDEQSKKKSNKDTHSNTGSWYEATDEDESMLVPIRHKIGDTFEIYHKKVISYDVYEQTMNHLSESQEAVEILKEKVSHLESILRMKDERIADLQIQLCKKEGKSTGRQTDSTDNQSPKDKGDDYTPAVY